MDDVTIQRLVDCDWNIAMIDFEYGMAIAKVIREKRIEKYGTADVAMEKP